MATLSQLTDAKAQDFANSIGELFKSVPHLPKEWITFLVRILPILSAISGVAMLLSGVTVIAFGPIGLVEAVISIASAALMFMAYKPLESKKYDGWMYMFWATVLGAVQSVLSIVLSMNLVNILGIVVGFYILFELRSAYKK